jgi:hypothetical protein
MSVARWRKKDPHQIVVECIGETAFVRVKDDFRLTLQEQETASRIEGEGYEISKPFAGPWVFKSSINLTFSRLLSPLHEYHPTEVTVWIQLSPLQQMQFCDNKCLHLEMNFCLSGIYGSNIGR